MEEVQMKAVLKVLGVVSLLGVAIGGIFVFVRDKTVGIN